MAYVGIFTKKLKAPVPLSLQLRAITYLLYFANTFVATSSSHLTALSSASSVASHIRS